MSARAPLFGDPIFDGAADPTVLRHPGEDGGLTRSHRGILEGLAFEWGRGTFWASEIFAYDACFTCT